MRDFSLPVGGLFLAFALFAVACAMATAQTARPSHWAACASSDFYLPAECYGYPAGVLERAGYYDSRRSPIPAVLRLLLPPYPGPMVPGD